MRTQGRWRDAQGLDRGGIERFLEPCAAESFYIPKPAFGAIDEARSLQVLDLVSQIITAAASKDALPKSSTVTLVQSR
jgi:hypothetical protein